MASYTSYDKLYDNLKNRFTVVSDNQEYTLGDYMLMKAGKKKEEAKLPVAQRSSASKSERALAMFISYVDDKLTVKNPPAKDKTALLPVPRIRFRIPFRSSDLQLHSLFCGYRRKTVLSSLPTTEFASADTVIEEVVSAEDVEYIKK